MHALHYTSPSGAFLTHLGTPTIYAPRLAAKGSRFKTGTIKHPRVRHETSTSIYVSTPPELSPSLAHPRTNTGPTTMRTSIEPQESPTTSPPSSKNPLTNTPHQYSTFPSRLKTWLVILVAIAAWLSTLSSFIYFPALTSLAASLHVSISKIDLTVTTYLVVSAITPAISGDLADVSGRRPVIVVCLIIYFSANVALALQRSYIALLLLRMLQSAGISGIFALAYGVVGDIASPAERGGYVGLLAFGTNSAPAFGPLIGTLLLAFRGWESIFWFLAGISATCLVLVIFTLPETARKVHPAIPLSLQFIMGAGAQSCFTMLNTLIVDLNSDAPSTAQASCNIVRCAFAGVGTAVLHIMIEAVGGSTLFSKLILRSRPNILVLKTAGQESFVVATK
ncbi:hypothetical protein FQN51_009317 [Onygenales sp. PD_10]|nr:hypothetical protein FQN51_009317 [Onygenales sp. PD_10]